MDGVEMADCSCEGATEMEIGRERCSMMLASVAFSSPASTSLSSSSPSASSGSSVAGEKLLATLSAIRSVITMRWTFVAKERFSTTSVLRHLLSRALRVSIAPSSAMKASAGAIQCMTLDVKAAKLRAMGINEGAPTAANMRLTRKKRTSARCKATRSRLSCCIISVWNIFSGSRRVSMYVSAVTGIAKSGGSSSSSRHVQEKLPAREPTSCRRHRQEQQGCLLLYREVLTCWCSRSGSSRKTFSQPPARSSSRIHGAEDRFAMLRSRLRNLLWHTAGPAL
mmetsp:Transcript_16788/g.50631  ORF Transcript_16788/g.50631 Transcript_16788/m.50631 type:complete len:281 (-) Transcript_16788:810-1652(-)